MFSPVTGRPMPRPLAAVGEAAAMAVSARRLLLAAARTARVSQLTAVPPTAGTGSRPTHAPVLLVHGYLGTSACWTRLVPALHSAGYADVFTFGYNAMASTIPLLAADVVAAAQTAMSQTGASHIHLVGHSLGGLLIRYAVQQLDLSTSARSVVTIATPHRGSPFASVAPGVVGAQMRPGSSLLHHLPPLASTPEVAWLVVDCHRDIVVKGPRMPEAAVPYRLVDGGGHQGVLRSAQMTQTVVQYLLSSETTQRQDGDPRPALAPAPSVALSDAA